MKALAKFGDVAGFERHAGRMRVTSEFQEQLGHGFQRFQQVEARNAAARPLRQTVVTAAQHECGPVEPLDHAAGHDSQHAAMPVVPAMHQRRARFVERLAQALLERVRLGILPLGVERM